MNGRFGGGMGSGRIATNGLNTPERAKINNDSAAILAHRWNYGMGHEEGALEDYIHRSVECFLSIFEERCSSESACVIYKDVNPSESVQSSLRYCQGGLTLADVTHNILDAVPSRVDLL